MWQCSNITIQREAEQSRLERALIIASKLTDQAECDRLESKVPADRIDVAIWTVQRMISRLAAIRRC
jgi:hypothetical protein